MSLTNYVLSNCNIKNPLQKFNNFRGFQVGVDLKPAIHKRQATRQIPDTTSHRFYIAAEIPRSYTYISETDLVFIIGDNNTYGMYDNEPLSAGQTYTVYVAYISRFNKTVRLCLFKIMFL